MSAALSAITGTEITIAGIRAGRKTPGLRPQHLAGLELVRDISRGRLDGAAVGSTHVRLSPGKTAAGGTHTADTRTAGSVALLLQASLPCATFADAASRLRLRGGTNADMAPEVDYAVEVLGPIAARFGVRFDCDVRTRGYYPRGGGEVLVTVTPVKELRSLVMTDRGTVARIYGRSFVAGVLPYTLAKDMSAAAVRTIRTEIEDRIPINIQALREEKEKACGNGSGIIVVAETSTGCVFAGSAVGRKGARADAVGAEAAETLLRNLRHGGCVDEFLQDQLIIFMALAKGRSRIRTGAITLHTKTAIHVAERLTRATFTISPSCEEEEPGGDVTYIIECDGAGVTNPSL